MCVLVNIPLWLDEINASLLKSSNEIGKVAHHALVATAVPKEAPRIVGESMVDGARIYKVEAPTIVTYISEDRKFSLSILVSVIVRETANVKRIAGIRISEVELTDFP